MRELLIGDVHFGIKNNSIYWLEQQLDFFRTQIFQILESKEIDRCIFLGDLTDIRYSINQQVGIELKNLFKEMLNKFNDIEFICLAGNHDYYSPLEEYSNYNSYELLFGEEFMMFHKNFKVVNVDPYLTDDGALFLPWYWTENTSHIDELLYQYDFTYDVKEIFCHTDLSCWPGPRIAAFKGCPIYSGHIHDVYKDDISNLYNVGSSCSFTFNDVNQDKYIYILDNNKIVEKIKNVTTPKFKRLYNEEIFNIDDSVFNNSYIQLCVSQNNINKARYVDQIKELKTKYIDSNIRIHIIDDDTNINTLSISSFDTNIENYIKDNIPDYLEEKYTLIKNRLNS